MEERHRTRLVVHLHGTTVMLYSDRDPEEVEMRLHRDYPIGVWTLDGDRAVLNPAQCPVVEVHGMDGRR